MIGLIDCEVFDKDREFLPNQEIMKLYAYFRRETSVKLLQDDSLISACKTIYVRKDTKESPIPSSWQAGKEVIWGGTAFSNGKYIPLSPSIENSIPNYHVYNEYLKSKGIDIFDESKKEAQYFDYSFVRLDNNELIRPQHIKMNMPLLVYHTNNAFPQNYEINFERIHQMSPNPITFIDRIEVENSQQMRAFSKNDLSNYRNWGLTKRRTTLIYFTIQYRYSVFKKIVLESAEYLSLFDKNTLLLPTFATKNNKYDTFASDPVINLERLMNFIYQGISYGVFFTIYETKNIDDNINIIYQQFIEYINDRQFNKYSSFIKYIQRHRRFKKTKEGILKIFAYYPTLRYLYDIDCFNLSRGGIWYGQFKNQAQS